MARIYMVLCFLLVEILAGQGEVVLEIGKRLAGDELREVFEEQKEVLNRHSVAIYGGEKGRNALLFGTVVREDGYILTKASSYLEIENVSLRIGGEKHSEPVLVALSEDWDLALLKVEAVGLEPVKLDGERSLELGTWVISNGGTSRRERRVRAGVISAKSREIKSRDRPFLGVMIDQEGEEEGLLLKGVMKESGAENAGLRKGDVLTQVEEFKIRDFEDIKEALSGRKVGAVIRVGVLRGGDSFEVEVELKSRSELTKKKEQVDRNDVMSGRYSERRDDFPRVIQHSTLMSAKNIGGPLLTIDGSCVGLNIAHANRSENYAIPAKELKMMIEILIEESEKRGGGGIDFEQRGEAGNLRQGVLNQ